MVALPLGVSSWALIEKRVCICILLVCLIQLLVMILGCSEVQIPMYIAAGKADFMLMARVWFLTQDLGQVISSVKLG